MSDETIIEEAAEFLRTVSDADSHNRSEGLEDLKFRYGDQWPTEIQNSRQLESRPCLTINETDSYVRQVTNQMRQQRPRIKVHPMNSVADAKVAEIITGITRHIELQSDADNAYDTAGDFAVTMGWGYWRLVTDYVREDSFDQEIYIQQIDNPFTVYFDPNSQMPDGSDAEKCLITDMIPRKTFEKIYPNVEMDQFSYRSTGDSTSDWITKDDIRIAEYFKVEKQKADLVMLSDRTVTWEDKLPAPEILRAANVSVIGSRESYKRVVKWYKVTGATVLETKPWAGRWIPVVPVYGAQYYMDGKKHRMGMVRMAKDPQKMINFWQTSITESIALAPKAKWLMAEGQDEGHENEWAQANIRAMPTLRYKQTDIDGRAAPAPQRLQPEPPPSGSIEAAMGASQNLQRVMGMFDPAMRTGNVSGKALNAEQQQEDQSNFHFYDNLTRSIKHTGRVILDLIPHVYDTQRVSRIIGDDGRPDLVTLNEKADQEGIQTVLNDVTVGEYDVDMDTGPGYNSKRLQAVDAMSQMLQGNKELWQVAGDLIFRNMDFPGAETIADRLAAANPLANIDEKSDVPPQAQMQIQHLTKAVQQLQQQLQAAEQEIKSKQGIVQMQEDAETKRELMRTTAKAHDIELSTATKRHDTEARALTAQNVEELKGMVQLLLHDKDTKQLLLQAYLTDMQAERKADQTEPLQ